MKQFNILHIFNYYHCYRKRYLCSSNTLVSNWVNRIHVKYVTKDCILQHLKKKLLIKVGGTFCNRDRLEDLPLHSASSLPRGRRLQGYWLWYSYHRNTPQTHHRPAQTWLWFVVSPTARRNTADLKYRRYSYHRNTPQTHHRPAQTWLWFVVWLTARRNTADLNIEDTNFEVDAISHIEVFK